ncbi:MAG: Maf family protein [Wenzhouxiangellaceae bacterium]
MVLASASPRRKELLAVLTPEFEVDPAEIDETVLSGEAADDYVRRIAEAKAVRVAGRHPRAWVLGSDTAVVLGARILGKPLDRDQARAMLRALSDRTHQVLSAVSLVRDDVGVETRLSRTRVSFARLPEDWIEAYAASGDCDDKAGAYAIQGAAAAWIQDLHGSYSGVVGLPLFETAELLRGAGLMPMLAPVRRPQTKSPP